MRTHVRTSLWALALVGLLVNSTTAARADDESTEGFLRITDGRTPNQGPLFRTVRNPLHQGPNEEVGLGQPPEPLPPAPLPGEAEAPEPGPVPSQPMTTDGGYPAEGCGSPACGCESCQCGHGGGCGACDSCNNCQSSDGGEWVGCLGRCVRKCGLCGLCKGCCLCRCKHSPDHGWGRPIKQPIYRTPIVYRHYWPKYWYGESGGGITGDAPSFPMVYMPTDTTQLGFYYQRVPTWTPNPAMIPPTPWPAHWHKRECINNTFGYYEATDAVMNGYGGNGYGKGCTTCDD